MSNKIKQPAPMGKIQFTAQGKAWFDEWLKTSRTVAEVEAAGEWPEQQPVNPDNLTWYDCPSCGSTCHKDDRFCEQCRRMLQ